MKLRDNRKEIEKCKIPMERLISSFSGLNEKDLTKEKKLSFEKCFKKEMRKHLPKNLPRNLTNIN